MKIVVTRAFLVDGKLHSPGETVEVSDRAGGELIAMNKAERAPNSPPSAAPGPLTTDTAPAVVKGKAAAKEQSHAG